MKSKNDGSCSNLHCIREIWKKKDNMDFFCFNSYVIIQFCCFLLFLISFQVSLYLQCQSFCNLSFLTLSCDLWPRNWTNQSYVILSKTFLPRKCGLLHKRICTYLKCHSKVWFQFVDGGGKNTNQIMPTLQNIKSNS